MVENVAHMFEVNDDWKELMGTEIMMKVIGTQNPSCGEKESVKIEPADAVLINFEARIANDREKTGLLFQQVKGWLIVVGDSDVLPALEMGVRFMEVGQTALIW